VLVWYPDGNNRVFGVGSTIYRMETAAEERPLVRLAPATASAVQIAADGKGAVAGVSSSKLLHLRFDGAAKPRILDAGGYVSSLRLSAAGDRAVIASFGSVVRWFDLTDVGLNKPKGEFKADDRSTAIKAIGLTADGKTVRTATLAGEVKSFDLESGAVKSSWKIEPRFVRGVDFAAQAGRIAVIGIANRLSLRDAESGKSEWEIPMVGPDGTSVRISPDGRLIAVGTGGFDRIVPAEIRVYMAADGRYLATFVGHKAPITALAFSPDGKTLASGSQDGSLRLWDVEP
jgi:WD40 repeat protein